MEGVSEQGAETLEPRVFFSRRHRASKLVALEPRRGKPLEALNPLRALRGFMPVLGTPFLSNRGSHNLAVDRWASEDGKERLEL